MHHTFSSVLKRFIYNFKLKYLGYDIESRIMYERLIRDIKTMLNILIIAVLEDWKMFKFTITIMTISSAFFFFSFQQNFNTEDYLLMRMRDN